MGLPSEMARPSGLGLEGGWDGWRLGHLATGGEGCMAATPRPQSLEWPPFGSGDGELGGLHSAANQAPPPGDTLFCAS